MERQIVIKNLPEALNVVKEMNLTSDDEWSGEFRDAARARSPRCSRTGWRRRSRIISPGPIGRESPTGGTGAISVAS